jgi:hypothetical protein
MIPPRRRPGFSTDRDGTLHVHLGEYLAAHRLLDTPRTRALILAVARDIPPAALPRADPHHGEGDAP